MRGLPVGRQARVVSAVRVLCIVTVILVGSGFDARLVSASAPDSEKYSITILPQMELLTAVQTQTSWVKKTEPRDSEGNDYYQAVKEFMKQFKDHEAVKVCQDLIDHGFSYDAPAGFVLHLGPLPDLDLVHEYSEYLTARAGGRERLEEFRLALRDLAHESDFLSFLAEWQSRFDQWVEKTEQSTDLAKVVKWWGEFAGFSASDEYHIILCPAMFYHNYGPRVYDQATGKWISHNVAAASASAGSGVPSFGSADTLERLSIHEIGHSFINPSFQPFTAQLSSIAPLYEVVRSQMNDQAYTSVSTFLNEQVLRAAQAIAEGELYGPAYRESSMQRDESRGFHVTSFVVQQLEDYAANRDDFPTFRDFAPVLLERLEKEAKRVASETRVTRAALASVAVVILAVVLYVFRRSRVRADAALHPDTDSRK